MFSLFRSLFDRRRHARNAIKKRDNEFVDEVSAARALRDFDLLTRVVSYGFVRDLTGVLEIEATHPNIIDLTTFVKKINVPLSKIDILSGSDCPSNTHAKSLKAFFVDQSGCYIPMEHAVKEFVPHAMELCGYLHEWKDAEPGAEKHNARILQKVLFSLCSISNKLLACSALNYD